jgi:tetratricopeptide (TPR) repeat protein
LLARKDIYFIALLTILSCHSFSRNKKIDSLVTYLKTANESPKRADVMAVLAGKLLFSDPDSSFLLANQALATSKKLRYEMGIATANFVIGEINWVTGNYQLSHHHNFLALEILERLEKEARLHKKDELKPILKKKSGVLGSISNVYKFLGDFTKALEFALKSLKIDEEIDNKTGMAKTNCNIGNIYVKIDYDKARFFYLKALEIAESIEHRSTIANVYANLALMYNDQKNFKKAEEFYLKALKIAEEINDKSAIANILGNLGVTFQKQDNFDKAIYYYQKQLELAKALGFADLETSALGNIGAIYGQFDHLDKARKYLNQALDLAAQIRSFESIMSFELLASQIDSASGNYKNAYEHYKKHVRAADSLTNNENTKRQTQLEMQFEFDKKQSRDSVKVAEERRVTAAEIKAEKNKKYSLYGGLFFVIIFSGFLVNRFRLTQKQKEIIEAQKKIVELQKHIVEEKNREVMDSIRYARRIQKALITNEKYIEKQLRKSLR